MMLAGAPCCMISRIDAGKGRDGTELADLGANNRAIMHDIAVVAELCFGDGRACANLGICPSVLSRTVAVGWTVGAIPSIFSLILAPLVVA